MLANKSETFPSQWAVEIRDLSAMWLIVKTLKSVLFYFSSFSISLMVVDFSKWKRKKEREVCFKHIQYLLRTPLRIRCIYTGSWHVLTLFQTNVITIQLCIFVVLYCVLLCCAVLFCVYTDWTHFFPRAKMMKNLFVHKLASECLYWSRKIHICITVYTHTVSTDWCGDQISKRNDTIRVRPYN